MKCEFSGMTDAISAPSLSAGVSVALKKAAQSSGVSFDYLYRVAKRESALNPAAQAKTSSAAGLFQFIEETWLSSVKKFGARCGLSAYAADIDMTSGRPAVADAGRRKEILELRFDPEKAAALAAELARENKASLESMLGRAVDAAELYAAHFLGAGGAKKLLSAKAEDSAAALLPAAANANRPVFYDGAREKTVSEVIESFKKTIGGAVAEVGEEIEKRFTPFRLETAAVIRDSGLGIRDWSPKIEAKAQPPVPSPQSRFEISSLSPLILAVLQALDPRDMTRRDRE